MEIIRNTVPFDYSGTFRLLSEVFGRDEAVLELPSLDGSESAYNDDFVYTAVDEEGTVHGTIHITVPKNQSGPKICGLSGLCCDLSTRGTGIGKKLFGIIAEESDSQDCVASFLGTNNPMASNIYYNFGYAYIPGSYVMARFKGTNRVRFFEDYSKKAERIEIRELNPADKIAVIPLFLNEGPGFLLDSNVDIFNNRRISQRSCMGLYPRYENLVKEGGKVFVSVSERGIAGGIASLKRNAGDRDSIDFFCMRGFEDAAGALLDRCLEENPSACVRISAEDSEKAELLERTGLRESGNYLKDYDGMKIPCRVFTR